MDWLLSHLDDLFSILTAVIALASMIAALTPTPEDDGIIARIRAVVDGLALNIGHAKKK